MNLHKKVTRYRKQDPSTFTKEKQIAPFWLNCAKRAVILRSNDHIILFFNKSSNQALKLQPFAGTIETSLRRIECTATTDQNQRVKCQFPFFYQGRLRFECMKRIDEIAGVWCPTELESSRPNPDALNQKV